MALEYEEELRKVLSTLARIDNALDNLEEKKEVIRESIKKFMRMHNLEEFDTTDIKNRNWRLQMQASVKKEVENWELLLETLTADQTERVSDRKVINWELLEALLTEDQRKKIIHTEDKEPVLKCQQVKHKGRSRSDKPKAPTSKS